MQCTGQMLSHVYKIVSHSSVEQHAPEACWNLFACSFSCDGTGFNKLQVHAARRHIAKQVGIHAINGESEQQCADVSAISLIAVHGHQV